MRLKLFFLGMFAAAFFMSCNNEIDGPKGTGGGSGIVESKGIPTYFAVTLPPRAGTYAGEDLIEGIPEESEYENIAVFIYKVDAAMNTFPENYAYISTNTTPVILKTTDGTKKVFVALNVAGAGQAAPDGPTFFATALGAFTDASYPDEGDAHAASFNQLNRVLWSDGIAGWTHYSTATPPYAPPTGLESSANGLIKSFAGGSSAFAQGLTVYNRSVTTSSNYAASSTTRFYLMSNWDNTSPDTLYTGSIDYESTCMFTFDPDIPKTDLVGGGAGTPHANNSKEINVQRAISKATLKFSTSIADAAPNDFTYISDGNDDDKGKFTPWNASASNKGIYAAGNINKESTVFQTFIAGSVGDNNYALLTCDPTAVGGNDDWYTNFDNIRVFGTGKLYRNGTGGNTVTNVRDAMEDDQAGDNNAGQLALDSVYLTENAQEYVSGYQDNSTYLVVGGQYSPRKWISNVEQAAVVSNAPVIYYNNTPVPSPAPLPGSVVYDPLLEYAPITWGGAGQDTLYYIKQDKIFIFGKTNLENYYAWVLKKDGESPAGTALRPWSTAVAGNLQTAINADLGLKALVAYYQGNCFYRIFINDAKAPIVDERVLVRRNHVYDVTISKILGPGIADPDDILIPGTPVLPADTYVEITINIQKWHRVEQFEDVSGE